MSRYLFPVFSAIALALSVSLPAQAALIKQTFKGNLSIVDPKQSLWQTPADAQFDAYNWSYKLPYELSYIFDDEVAPSYQEGSGSTARYSFRHGDRPGESLTFSAGNQVFDITSFGRGFGGFWGGPSPHPNWYSIGFSLNGIGFSFLFSSESPLNNSNLPTMSDRWKYQLFGISGGMGTASVDFIETSKLSDITPEAVPVPALLPGLLGLGAAVWKKKREQQAQEGD